MRTAGLALALALGCGLLAGCGRVAPPEARAAAAPAGASIDSTVIALEREKWSAFVRGDFESTDHLYASDFLNLSWTGKGVARANAAEARAAVRRLPRTTFAAVTISDFRVVRATPEAVVLSYMAEWPGGRSFVTSVWAHRAGGWQTVFYEDSPAATGAAVDDR